MAKLLRPLVLAGALTVGVGAAVLPNVLSAQTTNPAAPTDTDRD